MSYVLDALKKSEAERRALQGRGDSAPIVVNAQPVRRSMAIPMIVVLLLMLGAGWFMTQDFTGKALPAMQATDKVLPAMQATDERAPPVQAAPPKQADNANLLANPATSASSKQDGKLTTETTNIEPADDDIAATSSTEAAATLITPSTTALRRKPSQLAAAPSPAKPSTQQMPPGETATAPRQADIVAYDELPTNTQQSIPAISISGHIFDDDPASRMVILNGAMYREGQTLSNGLYLQAISEKGVVLKYQGQLFEMKVFNH